MSVVAELMSQIDKLNGRVYDRDTTIIDLRHMNSELAREVSRIAVLVVRYKSIIEDCMFCHEELMTRTNYGEK